MGPLPPRGGTPPPRSLLPPRLHRGDAGHGSLHEGHGGKGDPAPLRTLQELCRSTGNPGGSLDSLEVGSGIGWGGWVWRLGLVASCWPSRRLAARADFWPCWVCVVAFFSHVPGNKGVRLEMKRVLNLRL